MDHIARILGRDEVEFKKGYFAAQGQSTPTGGKYYDRVPLLEMVEKAKQMSSYDEKLKEFKGDSGRYKRGIGMAMFMHGCGFTGSAERDLIKAVVRLVKHENGTVEILCSNTDMGQGIKTTLSKIVGSVLDISPEKVIYNNPDTDRVPDSGPTVASRSLMTVGKLLERAALKLKDSWKEGEYQCIEEHYVHPQHLIPWSLEEFHGDAYPTFSWGVNVVEVKVDTLTAITEITGAWGVFDVGTAADSRIMQGQMEGGMLQGLGYGSMENMTSVNGVIQQRSITDYIIPTAKDTPRIETALVDNPYEGGPYGAKGAGELTLVGAAPAYVAAVEKAVNINAHKIPLLPEDLMELM